MKKNPKQIALFNSVLRFNMALAGRRGGKTFCLAERLLRRVACSPAGSKSAYIGPTMQHAKELVWDHFKDRMIDLKWQFKPRVASRVFLLPGNRKLYVLGAENIDRIRGHKFWHLTFDEIAYFSQPLANIWKAARPALSDLKGAADFGTTPDGKGSDAYEFFMRYKGAPNWGYHHWKTIENPWIDPQEIEDARNDLDEKAFVQEFEATWETFGELAYYNFDENLHIIPGLKLNYDLPVHLCFDFNVNPTTLLLSQYDGRCLNYVKEYSLPDSSTERTIKMFCEQHKDQKDKLLLKIRGDAAGTQRKSTTGQSDYQYIFESLKTYGFQYKYEVRPSNPPIVDRVKKVNGWLKPLSGGRRIAIDPSCKELIKDLSGQKAEDRIPLPDGNRGHKADAAGYDIYWQWLITSQTPSRSEDV